MSTSGRLMINESLDVFADLVEIGRDLNRLEEDLSRLTRLRRLDAHEQSCASAVVVQVDGVLGRIRSMLDPTEEGAR